MASTEGVPGKRIFLWMGILLAGLLFLGCITNQGPTGGPLQRDGNRTDARLQADSRSFPYDTEGFATGTVRGTMTIPDDSYAQAYAEGKTRFTIGDCMALQDSEGRARCTTQAAVYFQNATFCDWIPTPDTRSNCQYRYAIGNADPAACQAMGSENANLSLQFLETCQRQVAMLTGNQSLCIASAPDSQGSDKLTLCQGMAASGLLVNKPECRKDVATLFISEYPEIGYSIEWLRQNHPGARVLAWWDYGDALECAGLKGVLSEKNLDNPAIPEVAYLLAQGNESELAAFMQAQNATYLLLPEELIMNPGSQPFGGKYAALNYLACARENATDSPNPGRSACESEYSWETVYTLPGIGHACTISSTSGQSGVWAYALYADHPPDIRQFYTPYYPSDQQHVTLLPRYCLGQVTLESGRVAPIAYKLNETYANGDRKVNKALLSRLSQNEDGSVGYTAVYTKKRVWIEGNESVAGYEDRASKFYDSILYKAIVLDQLDGFQKVYIDPSKEVAVWELESDDPEG